MAQIIDAKISNYLDILIQDIILYNTKRKKKSAYYTIFQSLRWTYPKFRPR